MNLEEARKECVRQMERFEAEMAEYAKKQAGPQSIFEYTGRIYVRPMGRGITLEEAPHNGNDLEEQIPSGYYEANITIYPSEK